MLLSAAILSSSSAAQASVPVAPAAPSAASSPVRVVRLPSSNSPLVTIRLVFQLGAADDPAIGGAYLHAHAPNAAAIAFYERLGFVRGATVPGYYRRLRPPDAVLLERRLR